MGKTINIKFIRSMIFSFFTILAILIYTKTIFKENSYSFLLLFIYFSLLFYYYKFNIKFTKKVKMYSIIFSVLISLILSVGSIVSSYINIGAVNIFGLKNIIYCIVAIIGFSIFFYKIVGLFLLNLNNIKIFEEHKEMNKKQFYLILLVIFLGYLLYYIRFYPAIMTPDSFYVIHYANNFILSDYHTFGHTWFFGIFFHLGKFLFNNLNMSVGFFILIQMICLTLIFGFAIRYLYNKGLNKSICIIILLFYTLNPLFAHYSVTLWRDVLFGGSFVILFISLLEFLQGKIAKRNIILFIISILVILFFRNNGIYIFIFTIPFLILFIKNRMFMSVLCGGILIFYFIIKGPVFDCFNISKTTSVEGLSIPLQQMARVIASGREFDDESKEYLKKLYDYDSVSNKYSPIISDPIKNITNNEFVNNDKIAFIKTYLNLFFKYPNVYVEAYLLQTLGYWYPDVIYWATAGESVSIFDSENVYSDPLTPDWYNKIIDTTTSRRIPLNNLIWSVGLPFLILLFSTFVIFYKNNKKYILPLIPLYGLWFSIMIATPVFSELRYVFGLFTCVPLMIILIFLKKKEGSV